MTYDWIAAVYDKAVFTAFDTETTGLKQEEDSVVEIGGIKFDHRGVIARFNILINPGKPMPEDVTAVNNITDAMLADKPPFNAVIPDFLRFIKKTVLVAHNAPFDIGFINNELKRCKKPPLTNKVIDTLVLAQEVFPGLGKHQYRLQNLALQFGITALEAHRAEDDSRVCMEFFTIAVEHFFKNNEKLVKQIKANTNIEEILREAPPPVADLGRDLF
ncbi:3'-5' exonuclease [Treponema phagedenis]|uniref:3'-5' exonuclease n=1 Tax=Treponema phagedenis TaxID=162 RepID=A0A0B7GYG6_TREPH|nr:3'-5' exonuclease [Treponema phagedenis]EFW39330.1 exonuclease, DNA polymerase III, epsilon subunit family [Treponema phagedenis F0421]NVP23187.1 3'-5' exonuclease [Treponema phagedenis]QEJ94820.1 3'-5' exonuclease [Treponema phagedenis]QEJ98006.1 3'-5' exonuclease [Treponema phagedenis]QEK00725.1 3'-5' exonuclease [Treponema phagedenis]